MDKNKFRQLMDGYLKSDLSADDMELLRRWYDSFGESEAGVPGLENEQAEQKLREELEARIKQAVDDPSVFMVPSSRRMFWYRITAAAAVLITVLGGLIWWIADDHYLANEVRIAEQGPVFREVKTGIRQVRKMVLPDGSVIHLNANSIIRIPERMDDDKRMVFLDEGEAYFEVARDTSRPFVVQTGGLNVKVLGTAFNIKSYGALEDITVGVSHGKVRVSNETRFLGDLIANEGITYHKQDKQARMVRVGSVTVNGWINGIVRLEKARFDELAVAFYNLYGVRLKSKDPRAISHRYNMSLSTDRSLDETMDVICSIHKTTYRRTGNEITIYP